MSILMEALKKAEQAKRKVTEEPIAASVPAALELELTPTEVPAPKPEPVHPPASPGAAAPALTAAAFTMMTGRLAEASLPAANPHTDAPGVSLQPEAAPVPKPAAPSQPQITLAPPKLVPSNDNSTPVRAAPAHGMPQRRRISVVWIGGGIALVFILIGGGYWYYNSMAQYLTQQATLSAPQLASAEIPGGTPIMPTAIPIVTTPAPTETAKTPPSPTKTKTVSKPPVAENTRVSPSAPPGNKTTPPTPVSVNAMLSSTSPSTVDAAVTEPVPPPAPVNISRDAEQNDVFVTLQNAYRAYQSGDDNHAQNLYIHVLERDKHNRDALLGIAAIAVRQKDFSHAQEIYSELLTLDPKDSIAQAGFVGVSGSFDPLQQEARIKALLEQEPGAPHLLFTYATFLMQQQRWLEAARALQSALQGQRDNADYAFNLAVSFDHLGQADAAARYYRAALELSAKQSTRFRADDVRKRLQAMDTTPRGERSP